MEKFHPKMVCRILMYVHRSRLADPKAVILILTFYLPMDMPACFGNALEGVIEQKRADVKKYDENCWSKYPQRRRQIYAGHYYTKKEAEEPTKAAYNVCPYSNAIRGDIDVDLVVRVTS